MNLGEIVTGLVTSVASAGVLAIGRSLASASVMAATIAFSSAVGSCFRAVRPARPGGNHLYGKTTTLDQLALARGGDPRRNELVSLSAVIALRFVVY